MDLTSLPLEGTQHVEVSNRHWIHFYSVRETETFAPGFLTDLVLKKHIPHPSSSDSTELKGISTLYVSEYMAGGWTQNRDTSTFLLHEETEHLLKHPHRAMPINNKCA